MTSNPRTGIRTWGIPFKRRSAPLHALNGEFPTWPMSSEELRANTFVIITVLTGRKYAEREKFLLTRTLKMIFRLSCSQSKLGLISSATMVPNDLFQCGVCANSCTSVIPLLHFHQALIEKLYDVLKIYVSFLLYFNFPKYFSVRQFYTLTQLNYSEWRGNNYFFLVFKIKLFIAVTLRKTN